eukprot:s242_g18.t1
MGSAADGEMPSETVVETPMAPVAPMAPMAPLTPLAPVIAAAAAPEPTEPSSSKPETEQQETEGKFGTDGLPEALETEREAKRPRQMTQAEVEAEGMSDADVTMQILRLCQSSLEYTARQANTTQSLASAMRLRPLTSLLVTSRGWHGSLEAAEMRKE